MKRISYSDRDYSFGQIMLTLRLTIGLTQAGLAEILGVSARAVGGWETGASYPKVQHLKQFVTLAVKHHAFQPGHEEKEIRNLWNAAHQKALLDEFWVSHLLSHTQLPIENEGNAEPDPPPTAHRKRVNWGDALVVTQFYGREWELTELSDWITKEDCRLLGIIGFGGIGKTALVATVMFRVAEQFDVVIWRSLRDAPDCETFLDGCLQVLAPQPYIKMPSGLDQRLTLFLAYLREQRALVVLDNLDALLEEGENTGRLRSGFEGYEKLLRHVSESYHQSCVVFTSREKPVSISPHEGQHSAVRVLRLARLESKPCEQLLIEKGVAGSASERAQLIDVYSGNPLALKIVSQTIVDLFAGEIAPILDQGNMIFGNIRNLLAEQFNRLTTFEQDVLLWLAIMREPSTLNELTALIIEPILQARLLEAIESLYRRSLVERGQKSGSFTLQSVVLEYASSRVITELVKEIQTGNLARLAKHGLELAQSHEYVRQTQIRLIVMPILTHLYAVYQQQIDIEQQLFMLLNRLRAQADHTQGYAPANLLTLIREIRGHLRGLDLSQLYIRAANLQSVEMQDSSLASANIHSSAFADTFDTLMGIAVSHDGTTWAASTRNGDVRIWESNGQTLRRMWQAHVDLIWTLAFSPNDKLLITGGYDHLVKLWDVESETLLWTGNQEGDVYTVAVAPDGEFFATSGGPAVIVWDINTGRQIYSFPHASLVIPLAWSPDGGTIATGDDEGNIRLWNLTSENPNASVRILRGHTIRVTALTFSPDGHTLASSSWDGETHFWDVASGSLLTTLPQRFERTTRLSWSHDGRLLAGCGHDMLIWMWNVLEKIYHGVLQGHTDGVMCITFMPDSTHLISCGDSTLRMWDTISQQCTRILQGNTVTLFDVDWSPDGTQLISGGSDALVLIFAVGEKPKSRILQGHRGLLFGVSWSPDGQWLASCSWDTQLRLWDAISGEVVQILQNPSDPTLMFYKIGWSPDGHRFAATCYLNHQGIFVWENSDLHLPLPPRSFLPPQSEIIHQAAWSPNSQQLAGGSEGGYVYIWDANSGKVQNQFNAHQSAVKTLVWNPTGTQVATGGKGSNGGEINIWNIHDGTCVGSLYGHSQMVYSLTWGTTENLLVSGGDDGNLYWWDLESGKPLYVRTAHRGMVQALRRSPDGSKLASAGVDGAIMVWDLFTGVHLQTLRRDRPYERLNITGIRGLSEAQKANLRALGAVEDSV